ncbi:hypothetical protein ANN_15791 [Periplaneta americana]|uniref:Reverse transcriptase domain-containing protein n=1 Tax=Periplaneta americana TaxID=6978 RepID=A0ABQ8SHG4_PERAM|nr:hypothetical protein ANN_15791 [Periplaneta americana]
MSEGSEIGRGVRQEYPLSPILYNIYLENLVKNCFQNMGGVIVEGRRIKCIRFADDSRRDDTKGYANGAKCEQYGKINANKTKTMVVGRKIKKINVRMFEALALSADCTLTKITRSQQCVPITKRNSVNIENRTHVYMTFFAQNVFGNKLRKGR